VREWTRRLRVRLTFAYTLLLLALFTVLALVFYFLVASSLRGAADETLRTESRLLLTGLNVQNGTVQQSAEVPSSDAAFADLLILPDGTVQGGPAPASPAIPLGVAKQLAGAVRQLHTGQFATVQVSTRSVRVYAAPVADAPGTVMVVARSIAELERTLAMVATALLLLAPLVVAGGALLGYTLAARALAPVRKMAATARDITERDLDRRLDLELPDDELGELAATLDSMLARLQNAFEGLKRFTADASHELRAPLAALRTEAEVTLEHPRTAAEYRESLARIGAQLVEVSEMVDDLLLLARADAGREALDRHRINLADLLQDVERRWRPRASRADLILRVQPADVWVHVDRGHLRRAIDNLLDNAVRYTPPGGTISISAHREGDAVIMVADTGRGIAPEHLNHLFERFYRADSARAQKDGGSGLGLSLVDWIVRAHGGTVDVSSRVGAGTTVRLRLPLETQSSE
jgi:heavy metal sensor kinase